MASLNDFLDSEDEGMEVNEKINNGANEKIEGEKEITRDQLLRAAGFKKVDKQKLAKKRSEKLRQQKLKTQREDEKLKAHGKKALKKLNQPSDFYTESYVGVPMRSSSASTSTSNNKDNDNDDDDDGTVSFRDLAATLINAGGAAAVTSSVTSSEESKAVSVALKKKLREASGASGKLLSRPEDAVTLARKNRIAGYDATNKALTQTWEGTVKANLVAEHLHFPLNKEESVTSTAALIKKSLPKAQTELEASIHKVLIESGANKDAVARYEAQLRAEAAAANSNSSSSSGTDKGVSEEDERRMGLKMYYQQLKARRRAKIKSKSFRKIERQRKAELKELALSEMVENDPEAARELELRADRDRILERATLRHKADSKWAKKAKVKGLAKVPEIKQILAEKARIGNELTRKMNAAGSGLVSHKKESYDLDSEDETSVFAQDSNGYDEAEVEMGVGGPRDDYENGAAVDAAREEREMDDEERVEEVLRNSAGKAVAAPKFSGSSALLSSTAGGRRVNVSGNVTISNTNLFKEVGFGNDNDDNEIDGTDNNNNNNNNKESEFENNSDVVPIAKTKKDSTAAATTTSSSSSSNPWLSVPAGSSFSSSSSSSSSTKKKPTNAKNEKEAEKENEEDEDAGMVGDGGGDNDDDNESSEDENDRKGLDLVTASEEQRRLVREAFAGDESDMELELQREKNAEVEEAAGVAKKDTNALPGWGSWAGEGVVESQRAKERRLKREKEEDERRKAVLEKVRVIRKDADLKHVVLNEKVDRQAAVFKARAAPKGTTPEHYERMLSVPVGKEWQTTTAHRKMIVPKITVDKGKVIKPLLTPKNVARKKTAGNNANNNNNASKRKQKKTTKNKN